MTVYLPLWAVFSLLNLLLVLAAALFIWKITRLPRFLWLAGRYKGGKYPNVAWDFQGIFSTRESALAVCKDKTWFIGQVEAGKELPVETTDMRVEYPLANEAA